MTENKPAQFPDYEKKTGAGTRPAFQVKTITPPKAKWFTLENFYLENIPNKFIMADYQRKQNTSHVYKIVESIINNTFYDNIIRCVKIGHDKYEVIDGQHRLKALWILYKQYGIRNYTIIMQLFEAENAREIFRKINTGKKLTLTDHLKTLDTGEVNFFNELRSFSTHYKQKNLVTYITLLSSYWYYQNKSLRPIRPYDIEDAIATITTDELASLYRMAQASKKVYEKTLSPRIFNAGLLKVVFRVGVEKKYNVKEFENLLSKILYDEDIISLSVQRFSMVHSRLYDLIKTQA